MLSRHTFRRPHTTQEARNASNDGGAADLGYRISNRVRSARRLPNTWDDIQRSDIGDRCWKRNRHNQYKGG